MSGILIGNCHWQLGLFYMRVRVCGCVCGGGGVGGVCGGVCVGVGGGVRIIQNNCFWAEFYIKKG